MRRFSRPTLTKNSSLNSTINADQQSLSRLGICSKKPVNDASPPSSATSAIPLVLMAGGFAGASKKTIIQLRIVISKEPRAATDACPGGWF